MPAPDIVLSQGQVLLQQTDSALGLVSEDGKIQFGQVIAVYETSDKTTVGNSVMFDPQKGNRLIYGSTFYILINEQDLSGNEVIPP